jgi:hypothetical protein
MYRESFEGCLTPKIWFSYTAAFALVTRMYAFKCSTNIFVEGANGQRGCRQVSCARLAGASDGNVVVVCGSDLADRNVSAGRLRHPSVSAFTWAKMQCGYFQQRLRYACWLARACNQLRLKRREPHGE